MNGEKRKREKKTHLSCSGKIVDEWWEERVRLDSQDGHFKSSCGNWNVEGDEWKGLRGEWELDTREEENILEIVVLK